MSTSPAAPQKPGFFVRLLRFLVRLFLATLLGIGLGAVLFFGIPALYREFIQPVRDHTVQLRLLEVGQTSAATQTAGQIFDLSARLENLEAQSDANKAAAAELRTLQTAVSSAESSISAQATSSAEQLNALATLDVGQQKAQASIENSKQILIDSIDSLDARMNALETVQAKAAASQELTDQVRLLRAMQLVLRAEFYLGDNNYGLAAQDIASALGLLNEIAPTLPAGQAADALEAAGYLESALVDLPDRPVTANAKLQTAWQVLLGYAPTATPTPLPSETPTPIVTMLPDLTVTPTPSPTAVKP